MPPDLEDSPKFPIAFRLFNEEQNTFFEGDDSSLQLSMFHIEEPIGKESNYTVTKIPLVHCSQ